MGWLLGIVVAMAFIWFLTVFLPGVIDSVVDAESVTHDALEMALMLIVPGVFLSPIINSLTGAPFVVAIFVLPALGGGLVAVASIRSRASAAEQETREFESKTLEIANLLCEVQRSGWPGALAREGLPATPMAIELARRINRSPEAWRRMVGAYVRDGDQPTVSFGTINIWRTVDYSKYFGGIIKSVPQLDKACMVLVDSSGGIFEQSGSFKWDTVKTKEVTENIDESVHYCINLIEVVFSNKEVSASSDSSVPSFRDIYVNARSKAISINQDLSRKIPLQPNWCGAEEWAGELDEFYKTR